MKRLLPILCILFIQVINCPAQLLDLQSNRNQKKFDIPFEFENNFIIVKVNFNGTLPLRFIFDTGAEHTILTKREITDLMAVDYRRKFTIIGSDLKTELTAYLAQGVALKINELDAINRSILVLEEDYFRFEEFAGVNVQGILGADMFRRFIVKINYRRRVISLYDPESFRPPKGKFMEVPIEINRNKPYFHAKTYLRQGEPIDVKLLLDTGASLAFLLHTHTHPDLKMPPNVIRSNIGMGLGGFIEGFLGRVAMLEFEDLQLQGVVTNFQEPLPEMDTTYMNQRNGIIGNQILSRFTIYIDYIRSKVYIQPNRNFNQKFRYDRSGVMIIASGVNLNNFTVFKVMEGSPGYEAGLRAGDEIKQFNGLPVGLFSLADITRKLEGKVGRKVSLTVRRNGIRMKVKFQLRDLI